ncbi:hypothetical protein O6H91_04G078300 [Diphasiastrum complanatum]|uniref:Uncharacterized protein n=1 Tax=Diphasiastrum complanatum TaxID=34168 RepID=A0ACC2DYN1_DIPCM|nr:hypothetical protein O6H91_04G078300 [Diphasiastrum complanatum]
MALVGNKADLHDSREVLQEVSKDYADNNGMFFIETSAKTADNVNELFEATEEEGVCAGDEGGTWGGRTSQGLAGANEERTVISLCAIGGGRAERYGASRKEGGRKKMQDSP